MPSLNLPDKELKSRDLSLGVAPTEMVACPRTMADLRAKYRHLVWSNPDGASDAVYVYAALSGGDFHQILDFACVVGLEHLRSAWQALQADEPEAPDLLRAAPHVERIFRNIQIGVTHARQKRDAAAPHSRAERQEDQALHEVLARRRTHA